MEILIVGGPCLRDGTLFPITLLLWPMVQNKDDIHFVPLCHKRHGTSR